MKALNILRMVTFFITLLTSVPLFINYLTGTPPSFALITHLHVWFGLGFFIFGGSSMALMKKENQKKAE